MDQVGEALPLPAGHEGHRHGDAGRAVPAGGHGGRARRQQQGRGQHGRQHKPALDIRWHHLL
eukprot:15455024-Alexandrium_andersonii.AAC.1